MLTIYFGLNVTLNYSWLHIYILKRSLDEKFLNFTCITKLNLLCETNNMPKTTASSNHCVLYHIGILMQKKQKNLDTNPQSYYGGQNWKNGDKNVFNWENWKIVRWSEFEVEQN